MARVAIKKRAAKVPLHIDNAGSLGTRKPISVMVEPGQDAEASDYPAGPSRKGKKTHGEKSRASSSGSAGIVTSGKGRSGV